MTPDLVVAGEPAPWLSPKAIALACRLLSSHQKAFGTPLIARLAADASSRQVAQELFAAEVVVLAHDGADPTADPGPRLIYANRAALLLWQSPLGRRWWGCRHGSPPHPPEQASRAPGPRGACSTSAPSAATAASASTVRGRRFQIDGCPRSGPCATEAGQPCGQAACLQRAGGGSE
jgi:hypothetical protein